MHHACEPLGCKAPLMTARSPLPPQLALPQRRYIELVQQLARDGWQQKVIADRLGVSPSYVSQIVNHREPSIGLPKIEEAVRRLPIDRAFFEDPAVDPGAYKEYMGRPPRRSESGEHAVQPRSNDPGAWGKFVRLGLDRQFRARGLSDDDLAWVRDAPGRRGAKTLDFLVDLCEMLLSGGGAQHPDYEALDDEPMPDAQALIRRDSDGNGEGA